MPSTAEKKRIVADFLARCNAYADEQVSRYREQLAGLDPMQALALRDKIGHWRAYRAFNDYTLEELAGNALDDWFEN